VWSFLKDINSSRADEFRLVCDKKFDLSTAFKTPDELAAIMHTQQQGVSTLIKTQETDG
jgi:hypothetical protein